MANSAISGLTASAANAAATDVLPVVQTTGVGPVKMTIQQVIAGILGSSTIRGATVTTSQPLLDLTQTWNAGAVTFTGLKANFTDTASAAGSLLMDLQVGGVSQFSVRKDGYWLLSSTAGFRIQSGSIVNFYTTTLSSPSLTHTSTSLRLRSDTGMYTIGGSDDAILSRRGAANFRLGAADAAAPVAQTLSVQSVVAGTSNTAGANLTITGSQGTGTGAGGSIIFQVAPAGSSGTAQNALATALTIDSALTAIFSGNVGLYSNTSLRVGSSPVNWQVVATTTYVGQSSNNFFGFYNGTNLASGGSFDVTLYRDAANTLALRNGTNAQTFRVYNTFTDASNYERLSIIATTGSSYTIATEAAGTGSGRSLALNVPAGSSGLSFQTGGTTRWTVASSAGGGHLLAGADNTYDIGASGATRPRDLFVAGGLTTGAPAGGTAGKWKLGVAATVSPTSPNRTIEVDIGGTIYYIAAKTTND